MVMGIIIKVDLISIAFWSRNQVQDRKQSGKERNKQCEALSQLKRFEIQIWNRSSNENGTTEMTETIRSDSAPLTDIVWWVLRNALQDHQLMLQFTSVLHTQNCFKGTIKLNLRLRYILKLAMFLEFAISPFNIRKNSEMPSSGNRVDFSGNQVDFHLLVGKPGR